MIAMAAAFGEGRGYRHAVLPHPGAARLHGVLRDDRRCDDRSAELRCHAAAGRLRLSGHDGGRPADRVHPRGRARHAGGRVRRCSDRRARARGRRRHDRNGGRDRSPRGPGRARWPGRPARLRRQLRHRHRRPLARHARTCLSTPSGRSVEPTVSSIRGSTSARRSARCSSAPGSTARCPAQPKPPCRQRCSSTRVSVSRSHGSPTAFHRPHRLRRHDRFGRGPPPLSPSLDAECWRAHRLPFDEDRPPVQDRPVVPLTRRKDAP